MRSGDSSTASAKPAAVGTTASRAASRSWFVAIALYFSWQVLLRVLISGSTDLDESNQLVLTQKLSWGYGPQPPLYTWMQLAVFKLFGVSIFSLALLKNFFLLGTYTFTYVSARFITGRRDCGVAAAASLFFIPQIAWESQRDLTHSVLASTLTMATLFCFLRASARRDVFAYILFGLCAGFGLLAKFNYLLFFLGLLLAAVSLREFRPVVLHWKMGVALALVALLFLPTGLWLLVHRNLALQSVSKFAIKESSHWLVSVGAGVSSVMTSTMTFLGPLALIYGLIFWKKPRRADFQLASVHGQLLLRTLAAIYLLILLSIGAFGVRDIRDRWLQPILISTPVLLVVWLRNDLDRIRLKRFGLIALVIMLLVSVAIPGRIFFTERMGRTERLNRPYEDFAGQMKPALAGVPVIITDTDLLGGNLRLQLPDKTVSLPQFAALFVPPHERVAFAWDATTNTIPPKPLVEYAAANHFGNLSNLPAQYFSATLKHHHTRQMRLGLIVPPDGAYLPGPTR